MSETKSDTPRTDACDNADEVWSLCIKLERENAALKLHAEALCVALVELKLNTVEVILPNAKNLSLDLGQLALWDLCTSETDKSLAAYRAAFPTKEA